ncbi:MULTISPECIES: putative holin-like toxin [Bacillus subtilis group]
MTTYEVLMVMINFAGLIGNIMVWVLTLVTFIMTHRKKDTEVSK